MSEVQARPSAPRGRGSARGGRGGYGSRGGRGGSRYANGERVENIPSTSPEDEGEIGQLKKQYSGKLSTIKEMFPDWTDEDIVYALQETDGDLESTIERITEGNVSQWGEVKKKNKDRSRSKAKDPSAPLTESVNVPSRGGRGRGTFEGSRGGRGRGSDRGRGAGRGGRGGSGPNGARGSTTEKSTSDAVGEGFDNSNAHTQVVGSWDTPQIKAEDTSVTDWEHPVNNNAAAPEGQWGNAAASEGTTAAVSESQKSSLIPDGTRSWASMFAKPVPVPASSKAPQVPSNQDQREDTVVHQPTDPDPYIAPGLPPPAHVPEQTIVEESMPETPGILPSEPALNITPSKDELTETNLEQVLDTSGPPPTATAASTIESTQDPRSLAASNTPLTGSQQQPSSRPPMGGYATSAYKATGTPGRSSSFQRRVMEQQEAVVMPGNHAVDRAAVQFGSLGLNGTTDDLDVDEDREEAETRGQPPQHSPIAPRAALPPAPQQQSFPSQQPMSDSLPTPRQAPGLPPAVQQQPMTQQSPQAPVAPQAMAHQTSQGSYPYNQFGRYGQHPSQQESSVPAQKPYDTFAQQATQPSTQQSPYDGYPSHSQAQGQQQQAQPHLGGFSSASNDYSSYYTSDQQRNAYQNYYGSYGQQAQQSQQDAGASQQRAGSGFGVTSAEVPSQYPTGQAQQSQSRYGQAAETQTSGHSTPNPTIAGQQQHHQVQQSQHMPQQHQGQGTGPGGYPYGHPYYSSPYYAAYLNQFGYGNQGYGAPFAGKSGMYGQPHQGYGMSPQSSYEQSSSPANVGGFGQHSMPARDGALGAGGVAGYGRSGSAQPAENQQHSTSSGGFGSMPDVFGRSQSGYSGPSQPLHQQHGGQQTGGDETLKPYGDIKGAGGQNPSIGQPGRPGSAMNSMPGQPGQSGLPPPQSQQNQQSFGGYPSHLNHQMHGQQGSQYGAALGGHSAHHQAGGQNHQGSGYGNYGAGQFGSYYGSSGRGGWGGNYGH
ncbi:MAG: hypothetical protein M1830_003045 [Pleopsidium flavum]|nr:MAG: hypothetical protein M1830_003045 [Pleopsidium flavum]